MTQARAGPDYGIGGCGSCRHVFLVTPDLRNCPLCDRPADRVLAFTGEAEVMVATAVAAAEEASQPEPPVPFTVACPHCGKLVQLQVTEEEIAVVPPPEPPPAEEPAAAAPAVSPSPGPPGPTEPATLES